MALSTLPAKKKETGQAGMADSEKSKEGESEEGTRWERRGGRREEQCCTKLKHNETPTLSTIGTHFCAIAIKMGQRLRRRKKEGGERRNGVGLWKGRIYSYWAERGDDCGWRRGVSVQTGKEGRLKVGGRSRREIRGKCMLFPVCSSCSPADGRVSFQ